MRNATVLAGVLLLALAGPARADKIITQRATDYRSLGTRPEIFVPYTTNGRSAILWSNYVAPRIYASPTVDDPVHPQVKPVFNLIYYGSTQGFGDRSNGATPREGTATLFRHK
jgi:hypothetical protein